MLSCVHFREKWQLVFQSCGRAFDLSTRPEKDSGDTKKATEISLNVFRQYLKERELDGDQYVSSKASYAFVCITSARKREVPTWMEISSFHRRRVTLSSA